MAKHLVSHASGLISAAQKPAISSSDHWKALDNLTVLREDYGLAPASITVLRALMSFLPREGLPADSPALVWPSNRTLAERASGMTERSLRRHIDRLCAAGLIIRKTSSSGKRYALRLGTDIVDAFGFDLAPFLAQAAALSTKAETAKISQQELRNMRCLIRQRLFQLQTLQANEPLADTPSILNALRRKNNMAELQSIYLGLEAFLPRDARVACAVELSECLDTAKMSATDDEIDRHIQNTDKESILSVTTTEDQNPQSEPELSFDNCIEMLEQSLAFASEQPRNWQDLIAFAWMIAPMIGIEHRLVQASVMQLGPVKAALSILSVVQLSALIHKPGAYFRSLLTRAETGAFSFKGLINRAAKRHPSYGLQL